MNDRINLEFKLDDARDSILEARRKLGGPGTPGHISHGSVEAWLGNRPVAYDLRKLFVAKNVKLPEEFELLDNHDIWLVYYAFGISQKSNFKEVVRARLEVKYASNPHVTILQVFPETQLRELGKVGGIFQSDFNLSGKAGQPAPGEMQEVAQLPGSLPEANATVKVGGDVSLSLRLKVAILDITAAGVNNDYGLWEFRKHDESLAGDHQVGHVLLVRRPADPVTAQLRLSVDVGTFTILASSRYSQWTPVKLESPA